MNSSIHDVSTIQYILVCRVYQQFVNSIFYLILEYLTLLFIRDTERGLRDDNTFKRKICVLLMQFYTFHKKNFILKITDNSMHS